MEVFDRHGNTNKDPLVAATPTITHPNDLTITTKTAGGEYTATDNFNSGSISPWQDVSQSACYVSVASDVGGFKKALKFTDTTTSWRANARRYVSGISTTGWAEFWVYLTNPQYITTIHFIEYPAGLSSALIVFETGVLHAYDGAMMQTIWIDVPSNTWIHVRLEQDMATKKYNVTINGDLLAQNFDFRDPTVTPNCINVFSSLEEVTTFYIAYWGYSWEWGYTAGDNYPHVDWTITDPDTTNPYYEVYKNGSFYLSNQLWTSGQEVHVFIGPIPYEHTNLTIIAYDGQGNLVSDTVIINTSDAPPSLEDLLLWMGIPAIIAVIFVSIYVWQRKKRMALGGKARYHKSPVPAPPHRIAPQTPHVEVVRPSPAVPTAHPAPAPQVVAPVTGGTMVVVQRQYEYVGGKVRVKARVTNATPQGILRVRVALDVPESFHLLRVEPDEYDREGATVKLNDLLPKEEKAVAWVLEPLICGKERIGGTASGVDASGVSFAFPMAPLEIEVRCPLFARPQEVNLPTVQRMIGDLAVKSERVFHLPPALAPADALEVAKAVIGARDVSFVGILANQKSGAFDQSAWFYGVTKVGQKRFILTAAVSEIDQAIRIFTACDDEAGCTGFLAEAGAAVRRALVQRGAVDAEEKVKELVCEKCGGNLPRAPATGRDLPCPECGWTWRATDFFH